MDIKIPGFDKEFPNWSKTLNYSDTFLDQEDMSNLNSALINTGLSLKRVNAEIEKYDRIKRIKELEYKRKFRREIVDAQAATASQRKAIADINCEELESEVAYYTSVVDELTRISSVLRTDLDILKTIGFNLRQELKI